ncbi:MAG: hypothetical protein R3C42_07285 [Parvularculaceae bacterium]
MVDRLVANGGRVLNVTACGRTIRDVLECAEVSQASMKLTGLKDITRRRHSMALRAFI